MLLENLACTARCHCSNVIRSRIVECYLAVFAFYLAVFQGELLSWAPFLPNLTKGKRRSICGASHLPARGLYTRGGHISRRTRRDVHNYRTENLDGQLQGRAAWERAADDVAARDLRP